MAIPRLCALDAGNYSMSGTAFSGNMCEKIDDEKARLL